jgi:hypothetical protein
MSDLVPWLRAQLDSDEAAARDCPRPEGWHIEDRTSGFDERDPELIGGGKSIATFAYDHCGALTLAHVIRHDPASVLRDIAAKRAIVDLHICPCPDDCGECGACSGAHHADPTYAPCPTLRHLAAAYADRDGYRPEWAPS